MPLTQQEQYDLYNQMMHGRLHVLERQVRIAARRAIEHGERDMSQMVHIPMMMAPGHFGSEQPSLGTTVPYSDVTVYVPRFGHPDANLFIAEASIRRDVMANVQRRREQEGA